MIVTADDREGLLAAVLALQAGELIGLPTETVYGLAADAKNPLAVQKIFETKGRPSDHPLIVHVHDRVAAAQFATDIPEFAHALMRAFWPGPLTVILRRNPEVAAVAAAGQDTIGLRCPSHPVAQALLALLAQSDTAGRTITGLAAPSANLFGRVSPTQAAHVIDEFGDGLLVLDGGDCTVGIESTIVDCSRGQPILLRPGAITPEQLEAVCGMPVLTQRHALQHLGQAPKASGTLASHYAPSAKVKLLDRAAITAALEQRALNAELMPVAIWCRTDPPPAAHGLLVQPMPDQADNVARQLFATLRGFDALGVKEIWIEPVPAGNEWEGVRDRLIRAAH